MLLNRISLRDLEYAVAVAETRHFGRAAERCHVSQPALSAQIRKLEQALGLALFERTPRGVLVTSDGVRLIPQARQVLQESRRILEMARVENALAGELRIDAITTLGPYLFPHILRPLRERFPRAELVLREGRTEQILAALASGESDVALLSLSVASEGVATIPLFDEPFVAIHPPALLDRLQRPLTIADLAAEDLILLEEGHCMRDQALALCGAGGRRARRHATGLETLRHMVAAGGRYSLLPALAAESRESFGGLLAYSDLDDKRASRRIALAFRATDPRKEHYADVAEVIRRSLPDAVRLVSTKAHAAPRKRRR
jgi:LysR family hydrogen peroxide-inducible transcriptional activator